MNPCAPNLGKPFESFAKPKRPVTAVFLHCTASSNPAVSAKTVNDWHLANRWACIGYHYLIRTDGVIEQGRDLERTPAAQNGYNSGTIAICVNGLKLEDFSSAQYEAVTRLCREINAAYGGRMRFRGHREVSAKACPVFDYKAVLGLDANGFMV